jgi:glycosyltransferase involved in cell wall biosynthesis
LFTPGDANDLATKIAWAHANPLQMLAMGRAAYQEYLDKYTPEKNYTTLMTVYQNTIASNGASNGAFDEN